MIFERGRGSIYDLDANKSTTEKKSSGTPPPDVMSSYFTRDPDPEPVRGGRGNIVERPNERNDYLASVIANQMAETQRDDRNQFSHGLDPIPYNLGVPVPPQQAVVNPQTVDARNINPFVTSAYSPATDDPYILGDGEDYTPSYIRDQTPIVGQSYANIISQGIDDFGQAVYADPIGVGKSIASGVYEGTKDFLSSPVSTTYDYGKNVVQSGINLGTSEGLAGYLPEGVTEENATPEQLTAARQAKLSDIFQVGSVIPVAQGARIAGSGAKSALSYGLGQVKKPFISNAERLNKIAIEAEEQLRNRGFRNVGTDKNPQYAGVEVPSFIPDPKRNSGETIAEYRARQKIANAMYAKGASDAEVIRDAGINRVTYKTPDGREITRDFMLLQAPKFNVDETIKMMTEGAGDVREQVVSTGDGVRTIYTTSDDDMVAPGEKLLTEVIENIEDYKLLDTPYDPEFAYGGISPIKPDQYGRFPQGTRGQFDRLTEEIRYNPLYARDGDMGLKGTYAGIPTLITKTLPHEFDHLTMSRGDRSIFDESVGGGLDSIEAYRDTRLNDIARDLDTAEKLRTQKTNADRLFTNMGEKGALEEFPDIGNSVNDYVDNANLNSISQALKSDNYPSYKNVLKQNLDDTFGDKKINVSRIEGYADPNLPKYKTNFEIDKDDVLFVGNPDEGELIIKTKDGQIKSVKLDNTELDLKKLDIFEENLNKEFNALSSRNALELYQASPVEVSARGAVPGDPLTRTVTDLNLLGIINPLVKGDKQTTLGEGLGRAFSDLKLLSKYGGVKRGLSSIPFILGRKAYGKREIPISYEQMFPYATQSPPAGFTNITLPD